MIEYRHHIFEEDDYTSFYYCGSGDGLGSAIATAWCYGTGALAGDGNGECEDY